MNNQKLKYLSLTLIILAGFLLRYVAIINNGFWLDEAIGFFISRNNSFLRLINSCDSTHPFLYYFFIKVYSQLNTSVIFLRFSSLCFSLLSIVVAYKIGERLKISKTYGLLVAFLLSFSAFQIDYAWQLRMYSLELLMVLTSIYSFLVLLKIKNIFYSLGFILSNLTGLLLDYGFLWYLLSLDIVFMAFFIKRKFNDLNTGFVSFLLFLTHVFYLPYLPIFIKNFPGGLSGVNWIPTPTFNSFLVAISYFFGFQDWGEASPEIMPILLWAMVIFLFFCLFFKMKKENITYVFFLFLICLIVPLFFSYIVSYYHLLASSIFLARNLMSFSIVPIFLTALLGDKLFYSPKIIWRALGIFLLSSFIGLNLYLYINKISGINSDRKNGIVYKDGADFIIRNANLIEEPVTFSPWYEKYIFDYYFFGYDKNIKHNDLNYNVIFAQNSLCNPVKNAGRNYTVFWLVYPVSAFDSSAPQEIKDCIKSQKRYFYGKTIIYKCIKTENSLLE